MFMKKFIKKQVSLSLVTVLMLAIVIFSSSYALFQASFSDTNTQTLTVGDLDVAFFNSSNGTLTDNDAITLNNLTPMTDATALAQNDNVYSFFVNNSGTISYKYTVKLEDDSNYTTNLLNHQYVRIKVNDEEPMMLSEAVNGSIIDNYIINPGESITYQIRIWVADAETYSLPNETIGQEVHLNVIVEGEASGPRGPMGYHNAATGTLLAAIRDNQTTTQRTYTNPGEAISTTDEGLRETRDDYGTSYYYRGAVPNNFVVFANMCWRIVRITGDGSIKLTLYNYNPTSSATPCASSLDGQEKAYARYDNTAAGQSGGSAFNSTANKNPYIGFMYSNNPSSTDYATAHANQVDSTALTNLKSWYNLVFSSDQKDLLADVIWCNDKRVVSNTAFDPINLSNVLGTGTNTDKTYYRIYSRLVKYNNGYTYTGATPSLKCGNTMSDNKISKFTSADMTYGNGLLSGYKIGLLTADEVVFAGGSLQSGNSSYYLYKNANDGVERYLLLTPGLFTGSYAYMLNVNENGYVDGDTANVQYGLRPAIALSSFVRVTGGTGVQADPFVIDENYVRADNFLN